MTCKYCKWHVDTETYGWGFSEDNDVFHLECIEMFEGIGVLV